jgi:hypothetical protein
VYQRKKDSTMNHSLYLSAIVVAAGLAACDRPTVVTTPSPSPSPAAVVVPAPVPGPAGPAGPTGATGGSSTTIVVPPASAASN